MMSVGASLYRAYVECGESQTGKNSICFEKTFCKLLQGMPVSRGSVHDSPALKVCECSAVTVLMTSTTSGVTGLGLSHRPLLSRSVQLSKSWT